MKIGVAITERNRYEIFKKTFDEIKRYLPKGAMLVVVDDASDIPVPEATYRFTKNVGIAVAKNKCFEILYRSGCDHIFLFDSDCYPVSPDWWKPYVESPEPHLMYIFTHWGDGRSTGDTNIIYRDSSHVAYDHPRGCMLYYDRKCLDVVGGMDEIFRKWGYEHGNLSDRIFNAGLTSFRYIDVPGSDKLIYSVDEHTSNRHSTTKSNERRQCIEANKPEYEKRIFKSYYFPFIKEDVFITCYFTGVKDSQRKENWNPDIRQLEPLIKSIQETGNRLIVLHDCFENPKYKSVEFVRVETSLNPYIQRWISYRHYLMKHKYRNVFFIDATDVEVLRSPDWDRLGENLYVGDEPDVVACKWLTSNHPGFDSFYDEYGSQQLLNAGVVGGSYNTMMEFLSKMMDGYAMRCEVGLTDMALFNYVCRTKFSDRLRFGRQVTTVFKANERNNYSWIKHK